MRYRDVLVSSGLMLVLLGGPVAAGAGEPMEQLRANIDELYRVVNATPPSGGAGEAVAGRAIVDRMFDWAAMAETSLRGRWQQRPPAERAEFTRLFSDLFARAYLTRINLVDARTFRYVGDETSAERGMVHTKILTKRGSTLDVDYVVRATPDRHWRVQDVRVESISLIDNYRAQFDAIISRSSYGELVSRLRAKQ